MDHILEAQILVKIRLLSHNLASGAEAWHYHYQDTTVRYGLRCSLKQ